MLKSLIICGYKSININLKDANYLEILKLTGTSTYYFNHIPKTLKTLTFAYIMMDSHLLRADYIFSKLQNLVNVKCSYDNLYALMNLPKSVTMLEIFDHNSVHFKKNLL